jgi:hypothetical protein
MVQTLQQTRFITRSREDAIIASTTLADGISTDRLLTKTTHILIIGGDGKSLIVDAIARHLSDHHTAENMPADRFVEGVALASMDRREKKK